MKGQSWMVCSDDFKGCGRSLFHGTIIALAWQSAENHRKTQSDHTATWQRFEQATSNSMEQSPSLRS